MCLVFIHCAGDLPHGISLSLSGEEEPRCGSPWEGVVHLPIIAIGFTFSWGVVRRSLLVLLLVRVLFTFRYYYWFWLGCCSPSTITFSFSVFNPLKWQLILRLILGM